MTANVSPEGEAGRSSFLIDFHVHTPVSRCYSAREATAAEIADAALATRCDAVVVNDHHSAAALDDMRDAVRGLDLVVFPGVEITTEQGHIVAMFDRDSDCRTVWDLLGDLSIPASQYGNGHFRIKPSMIETIDAIVAHGALPIPAHVDRWPNGFFEAQIDLRTRREIHEHEAVQVLEITLPNTKSEWESGQVRGLPRALACIQGSDAHAPSEVGRRPTQVEAVRLDLDALLAAFSRVEGVTRLVDRQ